LQIYATHPVTANVSKNVTQSLLLLAGDVNTVRVAQTWITSTHSL